jgi:polyisoprenoid-binding protein YceI
VTRYAIGGGSRLQVTARSRVHDTSTTWDAITGEVEADAATLATAGATGRFAVDMTRFDAGDWLKNRKLRGDFELEKHPRAEFELTEVSDVTDVVGAGGRFRAKAKGVLRWRGKEVELTVEGEGTLAADRLEATARFELDIRRLGLSAPRFLMIKMEDQVAIEVVLRGAPR